MIAAGPVAVLRPPAPGAPRMPAAPVVKAPPWVVAAAPVVAVPARRSRLCLAVEAELSNYRRSSDARAWWRAPRGAPGAVEAPAPARSR